MLIDLQVHSRMGSPDSILSVDEIVAECLLTGIHGVALTEHNPSTYSYDVFGAAGLILVPAREVTCAGAHILVLCSDERMLSALPRLLQPSDDVFLRDDVACVWAHPGAMAGSGAYPTFAVSSEPLRGVIAAIEILNGRHLHFADVVETALRLSNDMLLPGTAGSDAHKPGEVGRCVTVVDAFPEEGPDGVVGAIRKGTAVPALNSAWSDRSGYDYRDDLQRFVR